MRSLLKNSTFYIFIAALMLRLALSFLTYHADVLSYIAWAQSILKDGPLNFYDRKFLNITDPNYPPLALIFFVLSFGIYVFFHRLIIWTSLIQPALFSNLALWSNQYGAQAVFLKLPAIVADLGLGILIYQFIKKKASRKWAQLTVCLFLFNPVVFYNSAVWGQIESVVAFFIIAAFILLVDDQPKKAVASMILALLIKQSAIIFLPIFVIVLIFKMKIKSILLTTLALLGLAWVILIPFHPQNTLIWFFDFYLKSTSGVLNFATGNAYNLWALLFSFDNRPDTITFLNLPYSAWGYIIFIPIFLFIMLKVFKQPRNWTTIFLAVILITMASFSFLTRMHERYLFPVIPFLILLLPFKRKLIVIYLGISLIHLVNLYHFWWVPQIPFLINLLDNYPATFVLSLSLLAIFLYLFKIFAFYRSKL